MASLTKEAWEDLELLPSGSSHTSETLVGDDFDDDFDYGITTHPSHSFPDRRIRSLVRHLTPWISPRQGSYHKLSRSTHRNIGLSWRRKIWLCVTIIPTLVVILIVATGIFLPSYTNPPAHYKALQRRIDSSKVLGRANVRNEKVFIAASIYDEEGELVSGSWGKAVVDLIDILGPQNVFLSVYENDPDTVSVQKLEAFKQTVPCNSSIIAEHLDSTLLPHVTLPNGQQRLKRITFLAEVRNRALKPLEDPSSPARSVQFDKLLYLNDVVFNPADIANLLFSTNVDKDGHAQYRAACATDFINPFKFYDTFATRDLEGYSMGIPFFPWFASSGEAYSRHDVLSQTDAVRVKSCWGGITAFEAKWFQGNIDEALAMVGDGDKENDNTKPQSATSTSVSPAKASNASDADLEADLDWGLETPSNPLGVEPTTESTSQHSQRSRSLVNAPIRFRAETDTFWDSSECCLINADLIAASNGPDGPETGVYLNPYIRVAYDSRTLAWLPFTRRFERLYSPIHHILTKAVGLPGFNPRRTEKPGSLVTDRVFTYDDPEWITSGNRSGSYKNVDRTASPGGFCGGRHLLILAEGNERGPWYFTEVPPDDP